MPKNPEQDAPAEAHYRTGNHARHSGAVTIAVSGGPIL
jgi:hypothetical protein